MCYLEAMIRVRFLFVSVVILFAIHPCVGQYPRLIKMPELLNRINHTSDTVLVLNFWATWCVPCVEELPSFFALEKQLEKQPVKFVYLSLDFKRELESKLKNFLVQRQITAEVLLLDEPDYDSWINLISEQWNGAIPATLVIDRKNKDRSFHEGILSYDELNKMIKKYIP